MTQVIPSFRLAVLIGLQRLPSLYEGTVFGAEKAKRRAKGKVAKQSRKINRPKH